LCCYRGSRCPLCCHRNNLLGMFCMLVGFPRPGKFRSRNEPVLPIPLGSNGQSDSCEQKISIRVQNRPVDSLVWNWLRRVLASWTIVAFRAISRRQVATRSRTILSQVAFNAVRFVILACFI
jgi:hypothetical protein